jgi:FixJ family two-component response regulator
MTKEQGEAESLVFVVDDDASVRQALTSLLESVALRVEAFSSAADFLKKGRIANGIAAACLILDIRLPGVSGLDFQAELAKADTHLPIIFISGYGRHPDDCACHEGGRDRIPNQTVPRSGSSRCSSARASTRS